MGVAVCLNVHAFISAPSRSSTTSKRSRCRSCPPPESSRQQPNQTTRHRLPWPPLLAAASSCRSRSWNCRRSGLPRRPPTWCHRPRPRLQGPKRHLRHLRLLRRLRRLHNLRPLRLLCRTCWHKTLLLRPRVEASASARRRDASYKTASSPKRRIAAPPWPLLPIHPLPVQTGSLVFIRFLIQRTFQRLFFYVHLALGASFSFVTCYLPHTAVTYQGW